MNHLKSHIIFYLGLAQLVAGWLASVDPKEITFPAIMLSASGLIALVVKYVQNNLPDIEEKVPTKPVVPVITGEVK